MTLQAEIEASTEETAPKLSPRVFPTKATTLASTSSFASSNTTPAYTESDDSDIKIDQNLFFNEFANHLSNIPNLLEDGVQLKSGVKRYGPPISVFGAGNFKTIFIIEYIIKERAIYTATANPTAEQEANNKVAMLNFYEHPIPGMFERQIRCSKHP